MSKINFENIKQSQNALHNETNFINNLICFAWLNTMRYIHVELIQGMSLMTFSDLPCYLGQ